MPLQPGLSVGEDSSTGEAGRSGDAARTGDVAYPTLAGSSSPFLRHGAEQPVRWMPWGPEALERAQREDRPILLDIGAVWCHWCHVMDRESYEDAGTAALINERFVPVKVDRDERPDVDARYQRAVQTLSGQGGWPLTAFLTPDGRAFYGGTYFPPTDAQGRPSFRRVLAEIARVWSEDRERAVKQADEVISRVVASEAGMRRAGELDDALVDAALEALADDFDFRRGGFGGAPKFPNPGGLALLLDRYVDTGEEWMRRVVAESLTAMGKGGVCDQLGGGFHRYATDARWLVPHFEKMAYDNGPLLEVYARAADVLRDASEADDSAAVAGSSFFANVADGILRYYASVAPDLVERGGFPASQDADIGMDDDGDYWTWTEAEVRDALDGDETLTRAALLRYGFDDAGARMHLDPSRHVLFLARSFEEVASALGDSAAATDADPRDLSRDAVARMLGEAACHLVGARNRRPRPFVDETVYADWTCLVASGHLAAARHLPRPAAAEPALRALERVWSDGFAEGLGIAHRIGDEESAADRFLTDQAFALQSFLDALEWTQDGRWLERARLLADVLIERFAAPDGGGFLDRAPGDEATGALAQSHRPVADSPEPAGNPMAALALLRLEAWTGDVAYGDAARRTLAAFAGSARRLAAGAATYFRAVDWATRPLTTVLVVGEDADPRQDSLLTAALRTYRPRTVVRRLRVAAEAPASLEPELRAMLTGEAPRAYVCEGRVCRAPVATAEELRTAMQEQQARR